MDDTNDAVLAAIRERRSIRKFRCEAVPREVVEAVLEAGRWAPSGLNNQPWRFAVVYSGDPRMADIAACTKYGPILSCAGALLVVLLDRAAMYSPQKDHQGAGACLQNMLLAIHALGYGGVWIGQILAESDRVLEILGVSPDNYELQAVIAMGRPAAKGVSSRKPLSELVIGDY